MECLAHVLIHFAAGCLGQVTVVIKEGDVGAPQVQVDLARFQGPQVLVGEFAGAQGGVAVETVVE